jgi:hypothetical protein
MDFYDRYSRSVQVDHSVAGERTASELATPSLPPLALGAVFR